ncbi:hypothetical protein Lesp02_33370 [Lentzea sp. NBRC 105346]|uniref:WXG100 family type VII secretion target n=1 Tax=Lentzea sp. NBRC 105346 TaxID=3032205 RepID=UPI0024A4A788|nr:WXG100 family type VII secretion target [Lentzea sp. NBRC 105346]GLZ31149.1 hypothetical protein Lesp02_33370 [Lentzea sp. NBRC 105346]
MSADDGWKRQMQEVSAQFAGKLDVAAADDHRYKEAAQLKPRLYSAFSAFASGEIEVVRQMASNVKGALDAMKHVVTKDANDVRTLLKGWEGAAAQDFELYMNAIESAAQQYSYCLQSLDVILQGSEKLIAALRADVKALIERTQAAYQEAEQNGQKIGLAVAIAYVGLIASVGAGTLAGMVVAGLTGSGGATIEMIGADSEFDVLKSMVEQAEQIIHNTDVERAKLEVALRTLCDYVTGGKLAAVRPERPGIVTAPTFDPAAFGLPPHLQGRHRRPKPGGELVVEPPVKPSGPYDSEDVNSEKNRDRYVEQVPK